MRQLSAYVLRQVSGCKNGPCPNWYELVDGDYMLQGDELDRVSGLSPLPGQALVRVPRSLVREGLGEVSLGSGESRWIEFDAEHLAFVGDKVDDPSILAGIEVSPGEIFIRIHRASVTAKLAGVV